VISSWSDSIHAVAAAPRDVTPATL